MCDPPPPPPPPPQTIGEHSNKGPDRINKNTPAVTIVAA